jgi:hypothetical protein
MLGMSDLFLMLSIKIMRTLFLCFIRLFWNLNGIKMDVSDSKRISMGANGSWFARAVLLTMS